MLRNDIFSVGFVTVYLFIYLALLQFDNTQIYGFVLLLFSPLLIFWMGYTVLKHGQYDGPDLGNEEFGYCDKPRDYLDVFEAKQTKE